MSEACSIEYRDVAGFPGYRVGDDGSVWSRWEKRMLPVGRGSRNILGSQWRPMKLGRQKDRGTQGRSYLQVRLSYGCEAKSRIFRVHRLVLEAFVGPCPDGMETRHRDGDPTNNRLSNLCWGTPAENAEDKKSQGKHGSRHYAHDGKTLILKDWARLSGIKYLTLWNRLNTGMPFAEAISTKRYGSYRKTKRQP